MWEMPSLPHPRRLAHQRETRPQHERKPSHCMVREPRKSCCPPLSSTGSQRSSRTLSRRSPWPDLTFLLHRICSFHRESESSERLRVFVRPADLPRSPRIATQWPGAELCNQQRAAQHGCVFEKIDHLILRRVRVGDAPELVHQDGDRNEKQDDEPCAHSRPVSDQNAHASQNRNYPGQRYRDGSQWDALCCRVCDCWFGKIVEGCEHENKYEEQSGQNYNHAIRNTCLR